MVNHWIFNQRSKFLIEPLSVDSLHKLLQPSTTESSKLIFSHDLNNNLQRTAVTGLVFIGQRSVVSGQLSGVQRTAVSGQVFSGRRPVVNDQGG